MSEGFVKFGGTQKYIQGFGGEKPEERVHLEHVGADWRILLNNVK
jgi:hypothetical protein